MRGLCLFLTAVALPLSGCNFQERVTSVDALPEASSTSPYLGALSGIPLTYDVENSGAHFPAPSFPDFDRLPIVRPLTDAFRFFDGSHST